MSLHQIAVQGFGADANRYDRARPSYPSAAIDKIVELCNVTPGETHILDVGAGTGKLTRLLADRKAIVTALEPVAEMRRKLAENVPEAKLLTEGTAEAIPLPDASVDVLTVAQAFHWFATQKAVAEFARVLKPGGRLVLIWNELDESKPEVKEIVEFWWRWKDDAPQYRQQLWPKAFETANPFGPLERFDFSNPFTATRQTVLDRCFSISFIAKQPQDQAEIIRAGLGEIMAKHGLREPTDTFPWNYATNLFVAKKL